MGGVSGVGGSGFYGSYESQPSPNQYLVDAEAALNRLTKEFSRNDLGMALNSLQKALDHKRYRGPPLTDEQTEHVQNAIESLRKFFDKYIEDRTIDLSDIFRAQSEVKLAMEV